MAGVDTDLAEQRIHTESTGFVRDDGDDVFLDLGVLQQRFQDGYEGGGGGDGTPAGAGERIGKRFERGGLDGDVFRLALGQIAAHGFGALLDVFRFRAAFRGPVEFQFLDLFGIHLQVEALAEEFHLGPGQFFLLMRSVAAFRRFA